MENEKENTDFVNYGTYGAGEADILRDEMEKQGIPVKVVYPGTEVGKETTAGAIFTAYKLLIRACDFRIAEQIREKFNIKPIKAEEKMPLPKPYTWAKKRSLIRVGLIGYLISFIGILIAGSFSDKLDFLPEDTPFYFIIASFIFLLVLLSGAIYAFSKERKKH